MVSDAVSEESAAQNVIYDSDDMVVPVKRKRVRRRKKKTTDGDEHGLMEMDVSTTEDKNVQVKEFKVPKVNRIGPKPAKHVR